MGGDWAAIPGVQSEGTFWVLLLHHRVCQAALLTEELRALCGFGQLA